MKRRSVAATVAAIALIAIAVAGVVNSTGNDPAPRPMAQPEEPTQEKGAAATAIDFLAGLTLERLVDRRAREGYLERHAAPQSLAGLRQLFEAEAHSLQSSATDRFSRAAVFGYRVPRRTARAADVYVWAASVGAQTGAPVAVGWRTIRVSLVRVGSSWKIAGVEEAAGPTPQLPGGEFTAVATRFRGVHATP